MRLMKFCIREKETIIDMEDYEFRKKYIFDIFLLDFLQINFEDYIIKSTDKAEILNTIYSFCKACIDISDICLFLLWNKMEKSYEDSEDCPFFPELLDNLDGFDWYFTFKKDIKTLTAKELEKFSKIFNKLIEECKEIKSIFNPYCEFCLTSDNKEHNFSGLSPSQRWFIYTRYNYSENPLEYIIHSDGGIYEETVIVKRGQLFFSDSLLHEESNGIDNDSEDFFDDPLFIDEFIDKHRSAKTESIKIYNCESIFHLCYAEFWEMIVNKIQIKKCSYCGKYFIPFSGNSEYCTRLIEDKGKTCKEYAPMYFYRLKKSENTLLDIYTKANNTHYRRQKRNPELYTQEQLFNWREKALEKLELAQSGEITEEEFREVIKPNVIK